MAQLTNLGSGFPPIAFLFVFLALAMAALAYAGHRAAKKRQEALRALAEELGLRFSKHPNHELAERYEFLNRLRSGHDRHALNVLSGSLAGYPVRAFDYHFATIESTDKGTRTTHHYLAVFALTLPRRFPEITIAKESFFSKIAQAVGFDDIDFESHEFSRKFCVRSEDKRLAYDVCNPRMIDYLLAHPGLAVEIESRTLAVILDGRMRLSDIQSNLNQLIELRELLPAYLFEADDAL